MVHGFFKHLEVYGGGISLMLGRGVYGAQDLLRPSVLSSGCVEELKSYLGCKSQRLAGYGSGVLGV